MERSASQPALPAGMGRGSFQVSSSSSNSGVQAAVPGGVPFQFRAESSRTTPSRDSHSLRPSLERALKHVQSQPTVKAPSFATYDPQQPAGPSGSGEQGRPTRKSSRDKNAPSARGRQAVFQRMKNLTFGVGSPRYWSQQMEDCETECKKDMMMIAASCAALGQKFTDQDFPPTSRSLYINGERPSSSSRMPHEVTWHRITEMVSPAKRHTPMEVHEGSRLRPGAIDDTAFLGAVAMLRAAGRPPDELIVHHDLSAGVVGVRLFKDGEWVYEVVDDYLPCSGDELACGRTSVRDEFWIAMLEKANAKVHGSYEAVQRSTELEALEDLTSGAVRKLHKREAPTGQELLRLLDSRQEQGCLHLAIRRRERRGEEHESGLLAGHGYPVSEVEKGKLQSWCSLENPWLRGGYHGGRSNVLGRQETTSSSFTMDADAVLSQFTEVLEVRTPPAAWSCYKVTLSTDRPSYPLMSARCSTQCLVVATQPDRRWSRQDSYLNGIGLRVHRCRVRAPSTEMHGARQDPKANPFEPLELVRRRPLGKTRSACLEFSLEPYALYIVTVDSQYRCPCCVLRFACSADVQFRELSAPEAGHLLAAQANATPSSEVDGGGGLTRSNSEVSSVNDVGSGESPCGSTLLSRRCHCDSPSRQGSWWSWALGCS